MDEVIDCLFIVDLLFVFFSDYNCPQCRVKSFALGVCRKNEILIGFCY